jgi:hypothetical protein
MWHHRNTSFLAFCFFATLAVFIALSFSSCSGVNPKMGPLALLGRQSFEEMKLKTAEGDELYIKGYNTQNPDPEFTAAAKDAANFYTGAKSLENITEMTVTNPNKTPKNPNAIPKNPNVIPDDPENIPVNPNVIPK